MAGLVPAIHALLRLKKKTWMPGPKPGMTEYATALPLIPAHSVVIPANGSAQSAAR